MTDHSDLIAELRALADCDSRAGEPLGKCMRRAADKIERLAEHVDYIEAQWLAKDAALSSQSLSLSEARERGDEYERLYRQTHLDYVAAEYRLDAISAAIGSPRFMDPPDGGDVSLVEQVRRMRSELEAKEARLSALENGPAGLADANSHSSLRKGAEVAVKPLEWREPTRANNGLWIAESIFGTFSVGFDDGWHACIEDGVQWEWEPESDPRSYEGPFATQEACQIYLETRIRSALVSGSREDGADEQA